MTTCHPESPAAVVPPRVAHLSVLVACHGDGGAHLREQLTSLAAQVYDGRLEVLLADNGMSPAMRGVAEEFAAKLPGGRVVDVTQRPGQAYALNAAARLAAGTHLVMLDDDDTVGPGYLEHVSRALVGNDLVGARLDASALNPGWLAGRREPMQSHGIETILCHRPAVVGAAMAVSRARFLEVGGFDETMATQLDIDLSWRLHRAGVEPAFVPEAELHYRYRPDALALWRQERAYGRGEVRLWVKHRPLGLWRRPLRWLARDAVDVVKALPVLHTRAGRARVATIAGAVTGRIEGSWHHRVLYL